MTMTNQELDRDQLLRLCNGNQEAVHWIQIGRKYIRDIDDLIDDDIPKANRASGSERVCRIGALALELYTHPFFVKHSTMLATAMLTNTNNYADSVQWEGSDTPWQSSFSDWAKYGWIDVLLIVAYICGGRANMRDHSAELRAMSYSNHHDQKGEVA
jgi:hypothetical protein